MCLCAWLEVPSPDRIGPKLQARAHSPDCLRQFRRRLVIAMRVFLPRDEQRTGSRATDHVERLLDRRIECGPDFGAMVSGSPRNVTRSGGNPRATPALCTSEYRRSTNLCRGYCFDRGCEPEPSVTTMTSTSCPMAQASAINPPVPSVSSSGCGDRTTKGRPPVNSRTVVTGLVGAPQDKVLRAPRILRPEASRPETPCAIAHGQVRYGLTKVSRQVARYAFDRMRPYEGRQADAALHRLHHVQRAPLRDHPGQIGERDHVACVRFFDRKPSSGLFHPVSCCLGGRDALRQAL